MYLVMEDLVGETLAQRLTKGPLLSSKVLALGAQIAEGLAAAHKAGIERPRFPSTLVDRRISTIAGRRTAAEWPLCLRIQNVG